MNKSFLSVMIVITVINTSYASNIYKQGDYNIYSAKLCKRLSLLKFPKSDLPVADDYKALKGCNPRDLYYGINTPINYEKARKCAFINYLQEQDKIPGDEVGDILGPRNILTMIYANGKGVNRDLDLASKIVCKGSCIGEYSIYGDSVGAAECNSFENEGALDLRYLQNLKQYPASAYSYDICEAKSIDQAGYMVLGLPTGSAQQGAFDNGCRQLTLDRQTSKLNSAVKGLTSAGQDALKQLLMLYGNFIDIQVQYEAHAGDEYPGGSEPMAVNQSEDIEDEKVELRGLLIESIIQFEQGKAPSFSKQEYNNIQETLNNDIRKIKIVYSTKQELIKKCQNGKIDYCYWNGSLEYENKIQERWALYSKQFIKFAKIHYPQVPTYVWQAWLARQRVKQLDDYIHNLSILPSS